MSWSCSSRRKEAGASEQDNSVKPAVFLALALAAYAAAFAQPAAPTEAEEATRREAAIAEFTAKTKAANYPALFDAAAAEFQVPADLLKAIAFAETRWEHLTWPPGETASPDTGMPRPYGIMSLWDNQYFGHSLLEGARLIGQDPETLKQDPRQNIRGAAALLRKLYDENPKPPDGTEADVENWRYAVRKYCGVPEADLNARHALKVYTFMSQGYHQYGIEWDARPVKLEPIQQETERIVAEEQAKRLAQSSATTNTIAESDTNAAAALTKKTAAVSKLESSPPASASATSSAQASIPSVRSLLWFIAAAMLALAALLLVSRKSSTPQ